MSANYNNILKYMDICGVNQKDIKKYGGYAKSQPFLSYVLNGKRTLSVENEKEIYDAINKARIVLKENKEWK